MANKTLDQLTAFANLQDTDLFAALRPGQPSMQSVNWLLIRSTSAGIFTSRANNLSDLADAPTARSNLGLGSAAVQTIGTAGAVVPLLSNANTWSAAQTFNGGLSGNLTGNVTGNVTGSSGSCTGNAATATTAGNCSGNAASATTAANCSGNATTATTANHANAAAALDPGAQTINGPLTVTGTIYGGGTILPSASDNQHALGYDGAGNPLWETANGAGIIYQRSTGKYLFQYEGATIASIDTSGNMVLKGSLTQNGAP